MSMPSSRSSPWIRGAPHSGLATLMSWINWRISNATSACRHGISIQAPKQAKTGAMPTNNSLWFYYREGVYDTRRNSIGVSENQAIELAENNPLRRFPSKDRELVTQRDNLRSSEALDRNIPMTAHQISLSTSPIRSNIARFAALRQPD
jgi:hypothetical protein